MVEWKDKKFKAIWRGSPSGMNLNPGTCTNVPWAKRNVDVHEYHRAKLIDICKKLEDCDSAFTSYRHIANQYHPMIQK